MTSSIVQLRVLRCGMEDDLHKKKLLDRFCESLCGVTRQV
jgi:hypothetical protein